MYQSIINNVCLASIAKFSPGGRSGTVFATKEQLATKLGDPHEQDWSEEGIDGAGKVHFTYTIDTPRGPVEIGDYWWNPKDQQSIRGPWWACLWAMKWLRIHGFRTEMGVPK